MEKIYKKRLNLLVFILTGIIGNIGVIQSTSPTDLSIKIEEGTLSVDIVNNIGIPIPNPMVLMTSLVADFSNKESTGILGTTEEQIFLYNPTATQTWTVSIGASNGPSALWQGDNYTMDYNDPDSFHGNGQLNINPSNGIMAIIIPNHITGNVGSTIPNPSGLTLGTETTFEQNETESITLFNSVTADAYRIYSLQNVMLTQIVPGQKEADNYEINMTITAL